MLCCLLLRMFHENLSLPCACGKQMKGEAMCYCTPKERFAYLRPACEDALVKNSLPSFPWQSLWNQSARRNRGMQYLSGFQRTPVLTAVMHSDCLRMIGVVVCMSCLVNCLWCFKCNTYSGSLHFPRAPLYQSLPSRRTASAVISVDHFVGAQVVAIYVNPEHLQMGIIKDRRWRF